MASIAIVTPSYNQALFLGEAVESVLEQVPHLTEYIVLDACSPDGSREVLDAHATEISALGAVVIEPDRGQSDAIIKGFVRTTSEILGWINSDDALLPGALQAVSQAFDADPTLDVVVGDFVFIDERSMITRYKCMSGARPWWRHLGVIHVPQQSCFFRRSAYERAGGLDESLHCVMDTDLWLRLMEADTRWGYIPRPLAAFRVHGAAKGKEESWAKRYRRESRWLFARHAGVLGTRRWIRMGGHLYQAANAVSGVYLNDLLHDRRWKGRPFAELAAALRSSSRDK